MTNTKPGRDSDQFALRLPDGMRDRIKAAADENQRSMNAEIVSTLREKYPEPEPLDEDGIMELFLSLPEEAQRDFLHDWLKKNVTDEDVRGGLIPGVRLIE